MSNQHLLSYLFMILIVRLTHGIPPPEGHAGVHDHHENGDTISITPEDEEKLQNFQLRFAEVRNKICDADTLSEDKLNAIHACHNKGPVAADSPQIMACEKQVFGEKTLDQKRKDMCNASHAERREKGHAMRDCIMANPELREKLQKFREEHQAMSHEDKKREFMARRENTLTCLENAMN